MSQNKVAASVIIRQSLRWPPAPAEDPADVLFLKAGHYFADLRVHRNRSQAEIDWSMGGTCLKLNGSTEDSAKIRYINVIDSRMLASDPLPKLDASNRFIDPAISSQDLDVDDVYDVRMARHSAPSSTPVTLLETGQMPNPDAPESERDVNAAFEEVWEVLHLPRGSPVVFLESTAEEDGLGKAFLARIGGYQLGLKDDCKGNYTAWRDEQRDGKWIEVYNIGKGAKDGVKPLGDDLPSWEKDAVVKHGDRKWVVREIGVSEKEHGEVRWV